MDSFKLEGPRSSCPPEATLPSRPSVRFGVELWSTAYEQTERPVGWLAREQAACAPCRRRIVGTGVLWTVVFAAIFLGRGELVGRRLFVVAPLIVAGSTLVGATR
jgi:hypothetical protein